jgi:hypothetical protein
VYPIESESAMVFAVNDILSLYITMKQIKSLQEMTRWEKFSSRARNLLLIKVAAYSTSAVVGSVSGTLVQQQERSVTGYDPVSHAEMKLELKRNSVPVEDFEEYKKEKKKGVLERFRNFSEQMKEGILHPKEAIKNTQAYKQLTVQFLDIVKYLDDTAFYLPAILTFILLGGFLDRKLSSIQGDVVQKREMELMRSKINELVSEFELLRAKIEQGGVESLSQDEVIALRAALLQISESLPNGDDLDDLTK